MQGEKEKGSRGEKEKSGSEKRQRQISVSMERPSERSNNRKKGEGDGSSSLQRHYDRSRLGSIKNDGRGRSSSWETDRKRKADQGAERMTKEGDPAAGRGMAREADQGADRMMAEGDPAAGRGMARDADQGVDRMMAEGDPAAGRGMAREADQGADRMMEDGDPAAGRGIAREADQGADRMMAEGTPALGVRISSPDAEWKNIARIRTVHSVLQYLAVFVAPASILVTKPNARKGKIVFFLSGSYKTYSNIISSSSHLFLKQKPDGSGSKLAIFCTAGQNLL